MTFQVVLCFNKVFWDPSIHLFGHVSNSTISRGELFLFWSISKAPVLIALIAGGAATVIGNVPGELTEGYFQIKSLTFTGGGLCYTSEAADDP